MSIAVGHWHSRRLGLGCSLSKLMSPASPTQTDATFSFSLSLTPLNAHHSQDFRMDEPAVKPPLGQIYDPAAPNPLYKWNVLCQILSLGTTTILISVRVYSKTRIVGERHLGPEDCTFLDIFSRHLPADIFVDFCILAWVDHPKLFSNQRH